MGIIILILDIWWGFQGLTVKVLSYVLKSVQLQPHLTLV